MSAGSSGERRSLPPRPTDRPSPLPAVRYRRGDRDSFRVELLATLRATRAERSGGAPFRHLDPLDDSDWTVGLATGWATVAEIVSFYLDRIADETLAGTAHDDASKDRIAHSRGRLVPPNVAASTVVSYDLSAHLAGVEAVQRNRSGLAPPAPGAPRPGSSSGGRHPVLGSMARSASAPSSPAGTAIPAARDGAVTTRVPAASQLRAVGEGSGLPPTYTTHDAIDAVVGVSRIGVAVPRHRPVAPVLGATTQLELAGVSIAALTPGQPIVISGSDPSTQAPVQWVRFLDSVVRDKARSSTRVGWTGPLDASAPTRVVATVPTVTIYTKALEVFGADAAAWSSLRTEQQVAALAAAGCEPVPRAGVVRWDDGAGRWEPAPPGLPMGLAPSGVGGTEDLLLVGGMAGGLWTSTGTEAFTSRTTGGARRGVSAIGADPDQVFAGSAEGDVVRSYDGGVTWSAVLGGPPTLRKETVRQPAPVSLVGRAAELVRGALPGTVPARPTPLMPASKPPGGGSEEGQVVQHQLPRLPITAIVVDPFSSAPVVGNAQDAYHYAGKRWVPERLGHPVFDLLVVDGAVLAATDTGVHRRRAGAVPGSWARYGSG
ncbi:MAG TPA: hypothetical protein VK507_13450, partial [Iamia sp.]|nr:hypothetical protein [Iamia sp.]